MTQYKPTALFTGCTGFKRTQTCSRWDPWPTLKTHRWHAQLSNSVQSSLVVPTCLFNGSPCVLSPLPHRDKQQTTKQRTHNYVGLVTVHEHSALPLPTALLQRTLSLCSGIQLSTVIPVAWQLYPGKNLPLPRLLSRTHSRAITLLNNGAARGR